MYAVVGRWSLDTSRAAQQQEFLVEAIVPRVRRADGFIAGYWSKPTRDGVAYSFIVFERAASAAAFVESVRRDPHGRRTAGVQGDELTIVEIACGLSNCVDHLPLPVVEDEAADRLLRGSVDQEVTALDRPRGNRDALACHERDLRGTRHRGCAVEDGVGDA